MYAIEIKELTKKFKDFTAVDGLSLEINDGELFALLGVNGAGKTTTIKMLSCLLKPDSGDALLLGKSIVSEPAKVKQIINVSPQETAVARNLTVRENLELVAAVYGSDKKAAVTHAQNMIEAFDLTQCASKKAKTLSGGTQRRLSIAMALISEPKILFLDEPTLGLDVIARRELWSAVRKLKGKVTVILTTHYMEEAEELSDRIGIMSKGKLRAVGTAEELTRSQNAKNFEEAFVNIATQGGDAV
ncbi:MAG: ABC transporter ATP-binding protein [Clostridiales bacterium]|nr:ABC transporter ATP-binding protein [Clostridiales bacterium]